MIWKHRRASSRPWSMRLVIGTATAIMAACTLVVPHGVAGPPDPARSTTDGDLMVANARGYPIGAVINVDPAVTDGYQVEVVDSNGAPLPGVLVTMELSGTGLQCHASQTSGQTANCGTNMIQMYTDGLGRATLLPAAVGINSSTVPNVRIRADGVLLTTIRMPSIDLFQTPLRPGTVSGFDFNEFRLRFLNLPGYSNSDLAADFATQLSSAGIVDGFDFNVFRREFLCGAGGAPPPCLQTPC